MPINFPKKTRNRIPLKIAGYFHESPISLIPWVLFWLGRFPSCSETRVTKPGPAFQGGWPPGNNLQALQRGGVRVGTVCWVLAACLFALFPPFVTPLRATKMLSALTSTRRTVGFHGGSSGCPSVGRLRFRGPNIFVNGKLTLTLPFSNY